jgi:hypothetical protein
MGSNDYIETIAPRENIFEDRRIGIDRRALLNMDAVVNDDRRNYHDRRDWRNFVVKRDWWLHVNYVESDLMLVDKPTKR